MAHPLQVYLNDNEFRDLEAWAKARGWTLSQAVRAALRALTRPAKEVDPLLDASGMIEGLPADMSERFGDYLGMTYVAEPPVRYGDAKRKRKARKPVRR
jgi:hypothetical protein